MIGNDRSYCHHTFHNGYRTSIILTYPVTFPCPYPFDIEFINVKCGTIVGENVTTKEDVLTVMRKNGKPMSAGDVQKALGADRADIDKAFKELKAEDVIVSPVRCKWEPK